MSGTPVKTLLDRTRELLHARPQKLMLAQIAAECGCSKQFLWLLMNDKCEHDFGVKKVQRVHDYLEQHRQRIAAI